MGPIWSDHYRKVFLKMLTCIQLEQAAEIQQLRDDYLRTLVSPMDGMWEGAIIAQAAFWEIEDQGQRVGYFCLGAENELLRFQLWENYLARSQAIFRWLISTHSIQYAVASTIEPPYFSLCLDMQKSIMLHSYLFRDSKRLEPWSALSNLSFRKAEMSELAELVRFYRTNVEGPGEWVETFLHKRIEREELFGLYERQTVVATGECIPSQKQFPYTDLGMVVAQGYRGRGLGSSMLLHLKNLCYEAGQRPICSCAAGNLASKKAIEKAGFVSEHRMVKVVFS